MLVCGYPYDGYRTVAKSSEQLKKHMILTHYVCLYADIRVTVAALWPSLLTAEEAFKPCLLCVLYADILVTVAALWPSLLTAEEAFNPCLLCVLVCRYLCDGCRTVAKSSEQLKKQMILAHYVCLYADIRVAVAALWPSPLNS